jgi:hypothetical protein
LVLAIQLDGQGCPTLQLGHKHDPAHYKLIAADGYCAPLLLAYLDSPTDSHRWLGPTALHSKDNRDALRSLIIRWAEEAYSSNRQPLSVRLTDIASHLTLSLAPIFP